MCKFANVIAQFVVYRHLTNLVDVVSFALIIASIVRSRHILRKL